MLFSTPVADTEDLGVVAAYYVYSMTVTVDKDSHFNCDVTEKAIHPHILKLHNISILTMDQRTVCNAKVLIRRDEPTENDHPALQFLSALWSVLVSFSSLVWCLRPPTSFGSVSALNRNCD